MVGRCQHTALRCSHTLHPTGPKLAERSATLLVHHAVQLLHYRMHHPMEAGPGLFIASRMALDALPGAWLAGDQFTDEFKKINPNSKIPALVDPDGPGG